MALPSSIIRRGTRAVQPAANTVAAGTIYGVTDEDNILERSTGAAWEAYSPTSAAAVGIVNGRLTTETGVPISTTDRTAQGTIFFTPYQGNQIALYDGSANWVLMTFAELSIAATGTAANKNRDVFVDYNGGTPQLVLGTEWTNDTTRAVALTLQDGVLVLTAATDHRYVGTIRTTSTTTTEDSGGITGTTNVGGKRFVWNAYNRVPRSASVIDTTNSWTYAVDTWRQARATAGNQVEYLVGLSEDIIRAEVVCVFDGGANGGAGTGKVGVGIDSTTTPTGRRSMSWANVAASHIYSPITAAYTGYPGLGYHAIVWLEKGVTVGNSDFVGDDFDTSAGLTLVLFN